MSRDASRILAEQFAKGLETTSGLLHNLQADVHASAITLTGLKTEVTAMRTEVDSLSKIIRDGNGERSLVARLLILERNIDSIYSWMDEAKKEKENAEQSIEKTLQTNSRGKWQLKIALLTSSLAFIGTVVSAILNFMGD